MLTSRALKCCQAPPVSGQPRRASIRVASLHGSRDEQHYAVVPTLYTGQVGMIDAQAKADQHTQSPGSAGTLILCHISICPVLLPHCFHSPKRATNVSTAACNLTSPVIRNGHCFAAPPLSSHPACMPGTPVAGTSTHSLVMG